MRSRILALLSPFGTGSTVEKLVAHHLEIQNRLLQGWTRLFYRGDRGRKEAHKKTALTLSGALKLSKDTKEGQKLLISNNGRAKATNDAIARDFRCGAFSNRQLDSSTDFPTVVGLAHLDLLFCGRA
ncbi:hypothetical protein Y032_0131g1608 [Ancylostoma ceylanicum]|uniref:Uncharacterized protein n=1 Tax=Ancylostoma ceylanicum TaxID=53326 RepID=A0A016T6W9_9BILA|nr:hypothetical protein Y032_0131g1608 [Ancylostoma ceylanicum]